MPRAAFGERPAPFRRIKRFVPGTVRLAASHETDLGVEEVGVTHRLAGEDFYVRSAASGLRQSRRAKIIIGIFQRLSRGFAHTGFAAHVGIRHIAKTLVEFNTVAAN